MSDKIIRHFSSLNLAIKLAPIKQTPRSIAHIIILHKPTGTVSWRAVHLVPVAAEVTAEALLKVAVRLLLLGVVLIELAVVLVVELLGLLAGVVLGLLAVDEVGALGLGETVDLAAGEAGEELLGEGVGNGLACQVVSG